MFCLCPVDVLEDTQVLELSTQSLTSASELFCFCYKHTSWILANQDKIPLTESCVQSHE